MSCWRHWVRSSFAVACTLVASFLMGHSQGVSHAQDCHDLDATLGSLYDVISGEAGVVRDEARFRNLFWPGAQLMAIRPDSNGHKAVRVMSVGEFYAGMSEFVKEHSFFEREISRKLERWDQIAHVWSTYEIRYHQADAQPFARGINSIQLFWDGNRWWVTTIYWQPEFPESPLPKVYLPKGKHRK